jgi:hypothetical protein
MFIQKDQSTSFSQVQPQPVTETTSSKFLTQEEAEELKQLNIVSQELIIKFGQNEYQLQILKDQKNELVKELANLKLKETQFSQALQNKYGNVNINLETGEITTVS